jgi:hypothetical protein
MAGCEQCPPALVASYRYLLGTQAGPTGVGIAVLLRENTRRSGLPAMSGRHGGGDWGSQHVTLLLAGPGLRPGVSHHPAHLVDLAPTIERFMGIAPDARDGLVLADAFVHPNALDVARQRASDVLLGRFVNALWARARTNTLLEVAGKLPNEIPHDEYDELAPNSPWWQYASVIAIDRISSLPGAGQPASVLAIPFLVLGLRGRRRRRKQNWPDGER